jgi:hypothetical protein
MNPWMSDKKWMQRYRYTDLHEILFGKFPIILTEWLKRLVEKRKVQGHDAEKLDP